MTTRRIALASLALTTLGTAILFRFPPESYSFYPPCPIHAAFGILCPGCGATRALAALIHGNLHQALRLNALAMLLLPFALAYAAESLRRALTQPDFAWPQLPPIPARAAVTSVTIAATIFTISRNLNPH
jgi:hypothetical protein